MKRILKNRILLVIITAIICITGTAYAATQVLATQIEYRPTWTKTNGEDITNVKDAIDELYNKTNRLITFGTSSYDYNASDNMQSKSTTVNLSKGKYIVNVILSIASLTTSRLNESTDITLPLNVSNGTSQKLAGKSYVYSASGNYNNQHTFDICQTTTYYVEIYEDNTTVSYNRIDDPNSVISNVIAIQAIPIN